LLTKTILHIGISTHFSATPQDGLLCSCLHWQRKPKKLR